MLFIYVQLRYHRQLNIISPESISDFFAALSDSVKRNGGKEQSVSGGTLYRFSTESVGFVFAASRVISDISVALEMHRERLREYLVLVDTAEWDESSDFATRHMERYQHVPLPDAGIFLSKDVLSSLDAYVRHVPEEGTPFIRYQGSRLDSRTIDRADSGDSPFLLYTEGGIDPVLSTIDMLERAELSPSAGPDATAISMYRSYRYEYGKPDYLVGACETWIDSALAALPMGAFPLRIIGRNDGHGLEEFARRHVPQANGISREKECVFSKCDLSDVPTDLLELAYLLFRSSRYVCGNELPRFFASLGRNEEFLSSLGMWLNSFGILADPADFRSLNFDVFGRLRDRIADRCGELDQLIAGFIWGAYESGELQPAFSLLDVLAELGSRIPDRFLVACLYHGGDPAAEIERLSDLFVNAQLKEAVRTLERARVLFGEGNGGESLSLARDVLHRFQKAEIAAGEYFALRLISDISLSNGKGGEAVTYLEYALENAERLHDSAFILQTRFDIAMLNFVNGDLSAARSALEALERMIASNLAKEAEIASLFMNGRISFELGDYADATSFFQQAGTMAGSDGFPDAIPLCKTWFARAIAHQHRFLQAIELLIACADETPDAWPFLLETGILAGKPITGKNVPDSISARLRGRKESPRFDWSTGFSFAEDLQGDALKGERTASRMFGLLGRYYRAVYEREGPPGEADLSGYAEAAREAADRGEPSSQVYFYLCYLLASASQNAERPEKLSCLSRGFKFLQVRAAAISNVALRESFLQNPTWNNRLYKAARENKLI